MATITVNGNTINPGATEYVSRDAKDSNFIYVQGYHDLAIEEKGQLAALGVEIQEYISEYTYLCRYTPEDLRQIQDLSFVRAANIYHAELKSTISLKSMVQNETHRTNYEIDLILHDNPNISSEDLAPYVAERAGVDLGELEVLPDAIRLTVAQDRLDDLAALDSVNRIEEVRPKKLYNDQARGILHADVLFNSTGYQGAGQVICLADTGFDQGLMVDKGDSKVHPAFGGRVERLVSLWPKYGAKDPVGHGTHVSGSACGDGIYTSSEGKKISMKGTAPAAKLMMQSMSMYDDQEKKWVLGLPAGVSKLFSVPYDFGYRIHSNSWGSVWDPNIGQLGYDREATATDRFINKYQDFIILIAAGNDADEVNHGDSQIGGNSAAKNCITVGATGTTRPNDGYTYKIKKPANSSGPTNTAVFSSRGPTKATQNSQGQIVPSRIKPDVAAPGVAVLSAASRSVAMDDKVRIEGGPSNDKDWIFMSGTSMATPLVAGCVALVREALQKQGKQKPSAALVKALLVNGAVNFSSTNGLGFDYEQGFGRVDIDSSINTVKKLTFIDGGNKLEATNNDVPALRFNSDVAKRWESPTISVPGGHNKLITTLVYPDRSGELTQNDVNLIVRAGGSERHGNMGTGTGFDHINNVERIIWEDVPSTTVKIIVQASAPTIPDVEQAFAVVWNVQP